MDRNYTNIEQSEKLLKLGLNPDTADMHFFNKDEKPMLGYNATTAEKYKKYNFLYMPCWSVGALIDLLPIGTHTCSHITDAGITYECYTEKERFECLTILDAVFSMIEWLLKIHWLDNSQLQVR